MENSKKINSSHFYVYNKESNNRIDVLDSFSKRLAALDVISGNRVLLDDNGNKLLYGSCSLGCIRSYRLWYI